MLCQKCNQNIATTHIRSVVNGVLSEQHLCSKCAANIMNTKSHLQRCECCGSNYDDIAKSGKCGCPQCYVVFYDRLLPYLKRVHGSVTHCGKKICDTKRQEQNELNKLRNLLNNLIKDENYEQAAIIRDKIKLLEGEAL